MAIAACLLIYSLAVMILTPWMLPRVTRSGWAPRAAVTAWGAALTSVVAALVAAPIFLATSILFDRGTTTAVLSKACVAMVGGLVGGRYGTGVQIGVLAVATALVARLVGYLARTLRVGGCMGTSTPRQPGSWDAAWRGSRRWCWIPRPGPPTAYPGDRTPLWSPPR